MSQNRDLLARLASGPRFLLLGQGSDESVSLPEALRRKPEHDEPSYDQADLASYTARTAHTPAPQALASVVAFAWNGVLTSRIDGSVAGWFQADWRRVVASSAASRPLLRTQTELQIRHLFGGVALPPDERPPVAEHEWMDVRQDASDVLEELARTLVTPRGVVLVEDWSLRDWVTPSDLYSFARRLGSGQLHLFSVTEAITQDPRIAKAIERGWLTQHSESLAAFLTAAEQQGAVGPGHTATSQRVKLLPTKDGFAELHVDLWNRVLRSARPIDLEALEPFPYADGPLKYQRFRTFLGASEGAPPWRAVASGFKFTRDFEAELASRVNDALKDSGDRGPIILQGQTASGKSLALVALAQGLAQHGRAAVLHQSRRRDRPLAADIEQYSIWAETTAELPTVLIWDGSTDPEDYFALDRQLRARGQSVLIVGTSYVSSSPVPGTITAPAQLSEAEMERVNLWLRENAISAPWKAAPVDTSFLALLYRLLPDTETGLRRGLSLELRAAESNLEAKSREKRSSDADGRMTTIAQALADAGYSLAELTPSEHDHDELAVLTFAQRSQTEQLSAMLLSAGRRKLSVPLELILRVIGPAGAKTISDFIRDYDIFRWTEDERGSQFLGVRTSLEAELLARHEITDPTEIEVTSSFIKNVRSQQEQRSGGDEVQFLVDLLLSIGPQSEDPARFAPWFGELADSFREMRDSTPNVHPRLVLTEVNLVREHVKRAQHSAESTSSERLLKLRQAEELLSLTLEDLDPSARLRLNLFVELAANLGSQLYETVSNQSPLEPEVVRALSERLLSAVMQARTSDPENHFPVDVLAWSTKDVVASGALGRQEKLRLLAETQASLESINPDDLSPVQHSKHLSRLADIAHLQKDSDLEDKYLLELLDSGEPSAYYLLATRALRSATDRPSALRVAYETLIRADPSIREDWMCSRLLLDVYWEMKTGARLLRDSRATVAFSSADWRECLNLIDTLKGTAGFDEYRVSFLRGLALFHLGEISQSNAEYSRLGERGLDLTRRVHLTYLASKPDGTASEFTGRVLSASADGRRGIAWVDQLSAEIPFTPNRFSPVDYRSRNEALPRFWIGFNYRGAIADPIRSMKKAAGSSR